ncbi:MAG: PilC/PilY family type IV pilus protein [Pseudomonadota bacterium]|nr:PilC/PilY family type IV pilus protein [Pseudomonadota bacterium]
MFKLKLKKSAGIALAMLAGVSAFPAFAADTVATKDLEIGTKPLYVGSSDLPMLIMLILSKDHTMFTEAYTDANDIDGDGRIDYYFKPEINYYGIFDSNLCYAYSNNLFFPVKVANKGLYTSGTRQLGFWYCDNDNAQWSGNLLNYVTTSRMDAVKRVLIGGERQTSGGQPSGINRLDTASVNGSRPEVIIGHTYITPDAHSWGKAVTSSYYHDNYKAGSVAPTLCNFMPREYTSDSKCSAGTSLSDSNFSEGSSVFLGVKDNTLIVSHPQLYNDHYAIGSLDRYSYLGEVGLTDKQTNYLMYHAWIWNWASRESGGAGKSNILGDKFDTQTEGVQNLTGITKFMLQTIPCPSDDAPYFNKTGYDRDESVCHPYTASGSGRKYYVPEGLVQQRAHDNEALFGLITSGYMNKYNVSNGVVRSPVHNVSEELNSDGSFGKSKDAAAVCNGTNGSSCGVLSTLNSLIVSGYSHAKGNWGTCFGNYVTWNPFFNRNLSCPMWGNPLGAMLKASLDYFNGGVSQKVDPEKLGNDLQKDVIIDSVRRAPSPYSQKKNGELVYNSDCQNAINLVLSEEDNTHDNVKTTSNPAGYNYISEVSMPADIAAAVDAIGDKEGITGGTYFIGKNNSNDSDGESFYNGITTLKTVRKLSSVAGLAPTGANDFGDYSMAGVALMSAGNKIDADVSEIRTACKRGEDGCIKGTSNVLLTTVVSMAPSVPRFRIISDSGQKVEIAPVCITILKNDTFDWTKHSVPGFPKGYYYNKKNSYQTCPIVDFYMDYVRYGDNNNPVDMSFRINYEDSTYGTDWDEDAIIQYHLRFNKDQSKALVSAYGYYSDGYASQHFGYSVSGVDVGKRDCDGRVSFLNKWNTKNTGCHPNWGTNTFFDIAKPLNDGSANSYPIDGIDQPGIDYQHNPDGSLVKVVLTYKDQMMYMNYEDANGNILFDRHWDPNSSARTAEQVEGGTVIPVLRKVFFPSVTRQFDLLPAGEKSPYLPSPSLLAAKYGYGRIQPTKLNTVTGFEEPSNYYYVNDASKLASQLKSAMESIRSDARRVATAASYSNTNIFDTGNGTTNSNYYQATFEEHNWTGELISYKVTVSGGDTKIDTSAQRWRAGKALFAQLGYLDGNTDAKSDARLSANFDSSKRNIFIEDKDGMLHLFKFCTSSEVSDGSAGEDSGSLECINQDMTEKFLTGSGSAIGLSQFIKGDVAAQNDIVERFVEYMRGDRSFEADEYKQITDYVKNAVSGKGYTDEFRGFRSRGSRSEYKASSPTTLIGDISSSTPVYGSDASGNEFVIFGANDGMIHVVSDKTGQELLAIIPYNMIGKLAHFADPSFESEHLQYVDGTTNVFSYQSGQNAKRVLALGTYGNGAKGGYALDLSDLSSVVDGDGNMKPLTDTTKIQSFLKWEFDDSNNAYVGKMMRAPKVFTYHTDEENAKTRLYAVYGNGYNSTAANGGPALIFVDVLKGKFVNTIYPDDETVSSTSSSEPLWSGEYKDGMAEPAVFDSDNDGNPDYIYAGDLHGNMYRLSLRKAVTNNGATAYQHGKLAVEGAGIDGNHRSGLDGMITSDDLKRLAVCTDPTGKRLSITTAPSVRNITTAGAAGSLSRIVMWGTGRYLISNVDNKYNASDPVNSIWMINDRGDSSESITRNSGVIVSSLSFGGEIHDGSEYDRTKTRTLETQACRAQSGTCDDGWVVDLTPIYNGNTLLNGGEKVVFNPAATMGRFIVNTLIPTTDVCAASAEGYQYVLNPESYRIDKAQNNSTGAGSNQRRFTHTATDVVITQSTVNGKTTIKASSAVDSSPVGAGESGSSDSPATDTTIDKVRRSATSYQILIDNEKPW